MEIITKTNKWTLLKLKSFCTTETVNKTKRQSTDWEKIVANDVTDKEFVSKIYKQFIMFYSIKTNNLINKWSEDLNQHNKTPKIKHK